jgi:hypothetical protein
MYFSAGHDKEFPHDGFENSPLETQFGILLIYLGGGDRYKIIDTSVAVKSRCVAGIVRIA